VIIPSTHFSLILPLQKADPSESAWQAFHDRYHDVIRTWCRRRELPGAWAEDLTQEIWLKLLRDIGSYDPAKWRLRSWLKAVVNSALTDGASVFNYLRPAGKWALDMATKIGTAG
jgi:hypothetical protein